MSGAGRTIAACCALLFGAGLAGCAQEDLVARLRLPSECEQRGDCPDAASPDAASPDAASPDAASPDAAGPDASDMDAGPNAEVDAGGEPEPICPPIQCRVSSQSRDAFCDADGRLAWLGDGCAETRGIPRLRYAICSCTDVVTTSPLQVDGALALNHELHIGADVHVSGDVDLGAVLFAAQTPDFGGDVRENVSPAPCPCDESFDVAAAVQARASDNDDADTPSDQFANFGGAQMLELTCGRYYFTRLSGSGPLRIRAQGNVALYVGQDIALDSNLAIDGDAASSVSLFVAGNVRVGGTIATGGGVRLRLVVGGNGTVDLNGDVTLSGMLYAPRSDLVTRGRFELFGSLFAERVVPSRELIVHDDVSLDGADADSCSAP